MLNPKSQRVRAADVHELIQLVGHVGECRHDPPAWRRCLLLGLNRLLLTQVGLFCTTRIDVARPAAQMESILDVGFAADWQRRLFLDFLSNHLFTSPLTPALLRRLKEVPLNDCATWCREQLVSDRHWYRHPHVQEVRRPAGLDHCLHSVWRLPNPQLIVTLSFHRPWNHRRRFTRREWLLLHLMQTHVAHLYARENTAPLIDPALSPRLRQTLEFLMTGHAEKQIAERLGLSPHTVHDYVKALYRHYRVSSRSELLARFIV